MSEELKRLTERWILAFCETPPLLDAELMARVLAEHEGASSQGADTWPNTRASSPATR